MLDKKERVCVCRPGAEKVGVVQVPRRRGSYIPFSHTVPPLQVAPSFACSVASLSQFPDHQLPGFLDLHQGILADYLLGQGATSAQAAVLDTLRCTSSPTPRGFRDVHPRVVLMLSGGVCGAAE